MNGEFIEKYGKAWAQMTDDMKMMSIMSEIYYLRENMMPFRDMCDIVKRHQTYFKAIWFIVSIVSIAVISLGIRIIFGT